MNSEMESFDFVSHTTSIFFFFGKFQELVMTSLDLLLVGRLLVALSSWTERRECGTEWDVSF